MKKLIRTLAITTEEEIIYDLPLSELKKGNIEWYWVDFQEPTDDEVKKLSSFFHFHPLAIEDCLEFVQRPKMDFYDHYFFVVIHSINQRTLEADEIDLFVSNRFIVTFHKNPVRDITNIWQRVKKEMSLQKSPMQILYQIVDKIVDEYFPPVYKLEDSINQVEDNTSDQTISELMEQVFDIRSELNKLRRTIVPMRDLLYRIISSSRLNSLKEKHIYFQDIYDHLLKLVEMIDANRELSSDIRDSYLSISSDRMNRVMMTLTVMSSIFLPLTFIAGVYGMNFQYMPELTGKYSYFIVLGLMGLIGLGMVWFFYKMGWFRFHKGTKL
ncbi:magnesium/cobalt transporter CorA [Metabacillus litoralis]|mgnify:CR=1 FL=1|uniref:magnesium/cobalt transporter CorA n=1 Tax=Metabacillus TaxID=2675233 RepID=UPI000EF5700E|nr:magnesium/cobalt transporter CorA [Metabacillus litoralis]MCM3160225.1 magnesium/cobalt transporter CorA [Metabacillus litoralis]MCM3408810.1 magnesium/cobalt transporter CorA [Metabacillus litoralis]